MKVKLLCFFATYCVLGLTACSKPPYSEPYSASPDGSKTIMHEFNLFGEADVVLVDNNSRKELKLFDLMFHDDNERVRKFAWSADGNYVAWLVTNSNRYPPHGTRLLVFKVTPDINKVQKVTDVKSEIMDFDIESDQLRYRDQSGKVTRISFQKNGIRRKGDGGIKR